MRNLLLIALALMPNPALAGSIEEAARLYVKENTGGNPSATLSDQACKNYLEAQQVNVTIKNCNELRQQATSIWRSLKPPKLN